MTQVILPSRLRSMPCLFIKVGLHDVLALLIVGMLPIIVSAQSVRYQAHVQDYGWMAEVKDYEVAGTTGQSKRLEALRIHLEGLPGASIRYNAHVQNIGWQGEKHDGEMAGTTGRSLRLEAMRIYLQGAPANMAVCYRMHVKDCGWLPEVCDGQSAGTTGRGIRAEAIQIRLADKSEVPATPAPQCPPPPPKPRPPQATVRCGIGTCRSNEHSSEFVRAGNCVGSGFRNATKCVVNTESFDQCGVGSCPAGYTSTSDFFDSKCILSIGPLEPNAGHCQR